MYAVLLDPGIYQFENAPPVSLAGLADRFAKLETRQSSDGRERWLNWVIRLPSGVLAGYVQATVRSDLTALIAYELASPFWRQGIGGSAVGAMLIELASNYRVHTAYAVFKTRNFRSAALLRSLGFEGVPSDGIVHVGRESDESVMYRLLGVGENATRALVRREGAP